VRAQTKRKKVERSWPVNERSASLGEGTKQCDSVLDSIPEQFYVVVIRLNIVIIFCVLFEQFYVYSWSSTHFFFELRPAQKL